VSVTLSHGQLVTAKVSVAT